MAAKRTFQLIAVVAILAASLASTGGASAAGGCASYITVQWGDTLSGIAALCGTTVEAIQAANPGLSWWIFAGQVLYIPTGYTSASYTPQAGSTYTVQWGDTLGSIAANKGFSLNDVLAVNPQIWNASLIYPGQVINLPAYASAPAPAYYYPSSGVVSQYGHLRVTAERGLIVRTGPGKGYPEVHSAYVSAMFGTNWEYRKNSAVVDASGFVWVEVLLNPLVQGYTTGWILVRDTLGKYYTYPLIDP